MNWTQEQYTQLTEHYRNLSNAELLHLAATPGDLTEIANEVLNKELDARKMERKSNSEQEASPASRPDDFDREADFALFADIPDHCLLWFQDLREVNEACITLREAGIDSQVRGNVQPPLLAIQPKDLAAACKLLNRAVPTPYDAEDEEVGDFITPTCPLCAAPDPVLTAFEPTNRWLCEVCEHEWDEALPAEE